MAKFNNFQTGRLEILRWISNPDTFPLQLGDGTFSNGPMVSVAQRERGYFFKTA